MKTEEHHSHSQEPVFEPERVFPTWVWLIYLFLFALSIPWYLPEQYAMQLHFGLPFWLICCIMTIFLMALFSVWIIHKYWKE